MNTTVNHIGTQPIRVLLPSLIEQFDIIRKISGTSNKNTRIAFILNEYPLNHIINGNRQIPHVNNQHKIFLHETFLTYLWCLTYSLTVLSKADSDDKAEYPLWDERTIKAKRLFQYGLSLISEFSIWDKNLPNPESYQEADKSLIENANSIFISAVSFILCHEISHIKENHHSQYGSGENIVKQIRAFEEEADRLAIYLVKSAASKKEQTNVNLGILISFSSFLPFEKGSTNTAFEKLNAYKKIDIFLRKINAKPSDNTFKIASLLIQYLEEGISATNSYKSEQKYFTKQTGKFKADIVIPHHDRSDLLQKCLRSIPMDYNVIVIRGGSYAENCNNGFKSALTDNVIFANDDVIFNEETLNELVEAEDIKIARQENAKGDIYIGFYYNGIDFTPVLDESMVKCPNSSVFKFKRSVIHSIGLFDEKFINGGEDQDIFFRAILAGYKFSFTKSKLFHALSQSAGRFENFLINQEYLFLKHRDNLNKFTLDASKYSIGNMTQAQWVNFAKENQVTKPFFRIQDVSTVRRTKDGKSYFTPEDFFKDAGGANWQNVQVINKRAWAKEENEECVAEPYALYFPQFHFLEENKENFYDGYHDMINLEREKRLNPDTESPLLGLYDLKKDRHIIPKQVETAKQYGLKGFGIYYYWFSHNNVTGQEMLMKPVVDQFFSKNWTNFDVFFIYANEDWCNPPFSADIRNNYSIPNIKKNIENLIPYFKHINYKKVNNKPVFFIHHSFYLTQNELDNLVEIFDEVCRANGFDGIEIALNEINSTPLNSKCKNYSTSPFFNSEFLINENKEKFIDYDKYLEYYSTNVPATNIHTLFYNFNNTIRYLVHKDKSNVHKTKNNSINSLKKFMRIQLDTYKNRQGVSKIYLINSWNEWGEQMAFEPSRENGDILLRTLKKELSRKYFFMMTHNVGGGSSKFAQEILDNLPEIIENHQNYTIYSNEIKYENHDHILYISGSEMKEKILKLSKNNTNEIFLQMTIFGEDYLAQTLETIYEFLSNIRAKVIINTQDLYWINQTSPHHEKELDIAQKKLLNKIFDLCEFVVHPIKKIQEIYTRQIGPRKNFRIIGNNDIDFDTQPYCNKKNIPFKIVYLGIPLAYKGHDLVLDVIERIKCHSEEKLEFYFIGGHKNAKVPNNIIISDNIKVYYTGIYQDNEVFNILNGIQPNLFLLTSLVQETWSYTCSIILKMGLPIFYNKDVYEERMKIRDRLIFPFSQKDSPSQIGKDLINCINNIRSEGNKTDFRSIQEEYKISISEAYKNLYREFITK